MLKKLIFLTISLSIVAFAQGTYEPSEVEESSNYETQDEVLPKKCTRLSDSSSIFT
jgi:hypothetical protein